MQIVSWATLDLSKKNKNKKKTHTKKKNNNKKQKTKIKKKQGKCPEGREYPRPAPFLNSGRRHFLII